MDMHQLMIFHLHATGDVVEVNFVDGAGLQPGQQYHARFEGGRLSRVVRCIQDSPEGIHGIGEDMNVMDVS